MFTGYKTPSDSSACDTPRINPTLWFFSDSIWSLGQGKGVSSLFRLIKACENQFSCVLFTADTGDRKSVGTSFPTIVVQRLSIHTRFRLINYATARLNFILISLQFFLAACLRLFRHGRPDLIYCSSAAPVLATRLLKAVTRAPTIHRIYGTFLAPCLPNRLDRFKKAEEVLCFALRADKYVITNDGTAGDQVARFYGIPSDRIAFWRNGVTRSLESLHDRNQIRDRLAVEHRIPKSATLVLAASRLVGWKRVDRIIRAANYINDGGIYFVIIGDGSARADLEATARNPNIRFIGSIRQEQVGEYLAAGDIFVSMYDLSNVGNPLFEAFSAGLPVITLDVGDTRSVVNESNGILIPFGDESTIIKALAEAIITLDRSADLREKLGNNARNYVLHELDSWEERIQREVVLIRDMIS